MLFQDFIGFLALVALSAVVGLGLNALRAKPLPLVYQPPAERMAQAAAHRSPLDARRSKLDAENVTVEMITLDELKGLIGKPDALILDARPDLFYEVGHIPSAQNLSKKDFEKDFQRLLPKLNASRLTTHGSPLTIVVYCPHPGCDDSEIVADALARLGFGPIRIFKGGWEAWEKAGLPVEGQSTVNSEQ